MFCVHPSVNLKSKSSHSHALLHLIPPAAPSIHQSAANNMHHDILHFYGARFTATAVNSPILVVPCG